MYLDAGMKYDGVTDTMPIADYADLHLKAYTECYRVTEPGGRIAVVVANVGRDPYVRLDALHSRLLNEAEFIDRGTVVWHKGSTFGTAWGSWRRPTAPQLRDVHESILIFQKPGRKSGKGFGDMTAEEFCAATQSVWAIRPASAKLAGHPAPFPLELVLRLIKLYTYPNDVVLDPFSGIGTTCMAAKQLRRRWIGVDIVPAYCAKAEVNIHGMNEVAL
jgi:site-specific DNA-methyltransferase (adenine-specific)